MSLAIIEFQVKEIIAQLAKIPVDKVDASQTASFYGIDSMGQLELRELLERRFQTYLDDRAFTGFQSIKALVAYLDDRQEKLHASSGIPLETSSGQREADSNYSRNGRITPSGVLYDEIEVGMSLTCLNNLAESPLLKYLGDLRWRHLSALSGVPSKLFTDDRGQRLYPSFFYAEMAFPQERPMAAYGENDRLKITSTLKRFGGSMLDGLIYLLPADYPETDDAPFDGIPSALAAGVPAVRLSNIFVEQFGGSEWLRTARPANSGFKIVPELALAPESYAIVKQAEKGDYLSLPSDSFVPMSDGPVRIEYRLVIDRDFSSTGLVYFANYPIFLDVCEREVLSSARLSLTEELINKRTIVRRKSAYLNNASARETLVVDVEPWIENPVAAGHPAPEVAPIRLFINYRMYRKSDARLMMVSSAEKLIFGVRFDELPFFSKFAKAK